MAMAQNITAIPAKRTIGTQKATQKVQKIRVAAYNLYQQLPIRNINRLWEYP